MNEENLEPTGDSWRKHSFGFIKFRLQVWSRIQDFAERFRGKETRCLHCLCYVCSVLVVLGKRD